MNMQQEMSGQSKKTIYLSGVSGTTQVRERIFLYNTMPKTIQIARLMLQRLDSGVAFVRDENGKYKQVGGTNTDKRAEIVDMIEKKYQRRGGFSEISRGSSLSGGSNIPAGFNDDGDYVGY
jgi:hypothetical protein